MAAKKKVPALKIKVGAESSKPASLQPIAIELDMGKVQEALQAQYEQNVAMINAEPGPTFMGVDKKELLSKITPPEWDKGGKTKKPAPAAAPEPKEPATMGELETIKNPRTGSVFHVLGDTKEGLRVSIRFYKEGSSEGHTVLGFRLRIGDQSPVGAQEYVLIENVKDFMRKKYPHFASSMSATPVGTVYPHVSIEGMFDIPAFPWDKVALVEYLTNEPFIEELWGIVSMFSTGGTFLMHTAFHYFIRGLIIGTVESVKQPEAPKGKMKWILGVSGARLMTSDKSKLTKKEALNQAGL